MGLGHTTSVIDTGFGVGCSPIQHLALPNQIHQVHYLNESLSNIIQSTEENPEQISPTRIQLHDFPSSHIDYIASFLNKLDYVNFNLSTRSIYFECNSPNALQQLSYSLFNFTSHPSVKHLTIDPSKTIQPNSSVNAPNFNQVTSLTLIANKTHGWLESFLDQVGNLDDMYKYEFVSLLAGFPHLSVTDDLTAKDIAHLCHNVVELCLEDGDTLNIELIAMFATTLKVLSFTQYEIGEFGFDQVTFDRLEERTLLTPDTLSFGSVLKSASTLKKIYISFYPNSLMSHVDIEQMITTLIVECEVLTYMCFSIESDQFYSILNGIESGLLQTAKQHRTQLRTHINMRCNWEIIADAFVNVLEVSNINDFMFIWYLHRYNGEPNLHSYWEIKYDEQMNCQSNM
eukprot:987638_1